MSIENIGNILAIIGAVVVALPPLLLAMRKIAEAFPGEHPDKELTWAHELSVKIAEVVGRLLGKKPDA